VFLNTTEESALGNRSFRYVRPENENFKVLDIPAHYVIVVIHHAEFAVIRSVTYTGWKSRVI
jgi:hypothetical protein